jgi:uncharacterized membrane protein
MKTKIKTALGISVVLNILLVGLVLGECSHSFSRYFIQNMSPSAAKACCESELANELPAEKRQILNETMRPVWEKMQITRAKINDEKKKALDLLKSQPFDEKAYRNQIHHISDIYAQMKRDMAEAVITIAKEYTPEERIILADIVAKLSVPPAADVLPANTPKNKP